MMCGVLVLSIWKPMLFVYGNPAGISPRKLYLVRSVRSERKDIIRMSYW